MKRILANAMLLAVVAGCSGEAPAEPTPTAEGSANSRLIAWRIATRMAVDNPVFGVGFKKFRQHFMEYNPEGLMREHRIVAHSSYFQVWAECGTPAFLIYIGLQMVFGVLASIIVAATSVRRKSRPAWRYVSFL